LLDCALTHRLDCAANRNGRDGFQKAVAWSLERPHKEERRKKKERVMKKLAGLVALLIWTGVPAFGQDNAQESGSAPEQSAPEKPSVRVPPYIPKYEVSGAGSYYSFYAPTGATLGMFGWNGTFQYNFRTWLGIVGEGFGEYKDQGVDGKTTIYAALAGGQVYPFKHRKVTVFGRALIGRAHYRIAFPPFGGFGFSAANRSATAYELGGGLDYNLRKHWSVRMVQADFDKADFFSGNANRASYRISLGVVYRFGQR
jgi:hypothetical protein